MASFSYILMGQAYLSTTSALADAWAVDGGPELKHAKLSEVRALLPEQEPERKFQITFSETEAYIIGCAYCLAHATIEGEVDSQGFFIQSLGMFLERYPDVYKSLAVKISNLAKSL